MKLIHKPLIGLFAATIGAVALASVCHLNCWAREHDPRFKVSSTPIERDVTRGTSYAPIVKKVAPSVVNIYSTRFIKERPQQNPLMNDPFFRQFFGDQLQGQDTGRVRKEESLGSGVIVSPDGYILTANHVVAGADEIKVSVPGDKTEFTAKVIGRDQPTDVAVLKIEAHNLPAVTLGDSDQIEVGDIALAVGNPFGVGQTVTMGIISALGRSGFPGFNQYQDFIQTDAAINPGNSGGALVDIEGRLIGINTAIISPSGGNDGIGFAVPINMARNVLEHIIHGGKVTRGYLGVMLQDVNAGLAAGFNLPNQNGALIDDVEPDSPADKAGLESGDVIIAINGKDVSDSHDLTLTISQCSPGTDVALKIIRNGSDKTITAKLGVLPGMTTTMGSQNNSDNSGTPTADALNGVTVADIDPQVRQQLQVPDDVKGAIVISVDGDSNSASAGLQANDIIVGINHHPVSNADDAVQLCKAARGQQILVKIWRRDGNNFAGTSFISVDNTDHSDSSDNSGN